MCGIVRIVGTDEVAPLLVESVTRLECQDYDSCGLAIYNGTGIEVRKDVGEFEDVAKRWDMIDTRTIRHRAHTKGHPWRHIAGKRSSSPQLRSEFRCGP